MNAIKIVNVATLLAGALSLLVVSGARAEPDPLAKAWLERSELAAKRLAGDGLDACDIAYEKAFLKPKVRDGGMSKSYSLSVVVSGRAMEVAYSYRKGKLASFELLSLPPLWLARQRADSKTLSILIAPARCAMDFCTDDPLSGGACKGDTVEQ